MSHATSVSPTLIDIYQKLGQNPQVILKNYAMDHVLAKIQKYEAESQKFAAKYNTPFADFQKKVAKMKNAENFSWEDDLMDWEFSTENLQYWTKVLETLKSA